MAAASPAASASAYAIASFGQVSAWLNLHTDLMTTPPGHDSLARMRRSSRRLLLLILAIPVLLSILAGLYATGMTYLEGQPRTFMESLGWAAETLTTTGYGFDAHWNHPAMLLYVIAVQFVGVFFVFLVFPIFLIPFLEERFEMRLPTTLPNLEGHVLIYRYGPAVASLLDELGRAGVPSVILEEDEALARRLHDRGRTVVLAHLDETDADLSTLVGARGVIANGDDHDNAALTLSARHQGFTGPIVALVDRPALRNPMMRAGATAAFTPIHVLAAAIAAKASIRISPRIAGVGHLGRHLEVAEMRVHAGSPLAGQTVSEANVRARTGATIVAEWIDGELLEQPHPSSRLNVGAILVVAGSQASIERLSELATPVTRPGPFVVVGHGEVGQKVAEFLRDANEGVRVVHPKPGDGIDHVGDPLDQAVLAQAGVGDAQAVVLALDDDSETIFAAAVLRNLAPDVVIIASARRSENVARIRRAGADFALSLSQVAGQLLAYQLLGEESVSLAAQIKIVSTSSGTLAGRSLGSTRIRDRTRCSVVAVERGDDVIVDLSDDFKLSAGDVVYVSGTNETLAEYFRCFPEARHSPIPRMKTPLVDPEEPSPGVGHGV